MRIEQSKKLQVRSARIPAMFNWLWRLNNTITTKYGNIEAMACHLSRIKARHSANNIVNGKWYVGRGKWFSWSDIMQIIFQPKQDWVPVWLLNLSNCLSSLWNAVDCEACLVSSTNCTTLRNQYDWTPDTPVQSGKIPNVPGFKSGHPVQRRPTRQQWLQSYKLIKLWPGELTHSDLAISYRHPGIRLYPVQVISRPSQLCSLKALATELHNLHTIE